MQVIFKKIDNNWKVINCVESGVEKSVPSESSKRLNQVELGKQFLGTWKAEIAKDTFNIWEQKLFGPGMEATIKIVTKGKIITEGKAIMGYNEKNDNLIEADLI
jgi:hypothetical protein